MNLLLDTHIFLWFVTGDLRLSKEFKDAITDSENRVFLSVAFYWEIIVKYNLGRLPLPEPPQTYIPKQRRLHLIESKPITESSLSHLAGLPNLHRDPFDRCLISQALSENLTVLTVDPEIKKYKLSLL